jgi:TetR/AcrR family transcriptional regulator, lmrAB and yxaGH operons repressor
MKAAHLGAQGLPHAGVRVRVEFDDLSALQCFIDGLDFDARARNGRPARNPAEDIPGAGDQKEVLEASVADSGAARGVIYHHFPGGKDDLAEQAVAWTDRRVRADLESIEAGEPDLVLRDFIARIRPVVVMAAGGTSCAVAAVTLEASPSHASLTAAVDAAFQSWIDALETRLHQAGMASPKARATAQIMIAFLEGSLVLARATGSVAVFDESASALRKVLTHPMP